MSLCTFKHVLSSITSFLINCFDPLTLYTPGVYLCTSEEQERHAAVLFSLSRNEVQTSFTVHSPELPLASLCDLLAAGDYRFNYTKRSNHLLTWARLARNNRESKCYEINGAFHIHTYIHCKRKKLNKVLLNEL